MTKQWCLHPQLKVIAQLEAPIPGDFHVFSSKIEAERALWNLCHIELEHLTKVLKNLGRGVSPYQVQQLKDLNK